MTFELNLRPEFDAQLRESANARGLTVEQYVSKLIEESVPIRRSEAALTLLDAWEKEDATDDREVLERHRNEWASLKSAMNERHSSRIRRCLGEPTTPSAIR